MSNSGTWGSWGGGDGAFEDDSAFGCGLDFLDDNDPFEVLVASALAAGFLLTDASGLRQISPWATGANTFQSVGAPAAEASSSAGAAATPSMGGKSLVQQLRGNVAKGVPLASRDEVLVCICSFCVCVCLRPSRPDGWRVL